MKRSLLFVVTVCFALSVLAAPAHALLLRYTPTVGETYNYKVTVAGRMETTVPEMPQPLRIEMSMEMPYSEKVLSQTDEITRLEQKMLGGSGSVTLMGQQQNIPMPTGRIVVDTDQRGRVVKIVEMDMEGLQAAQLMGPGADSFSNWSQFSAFPEQAVDPGDTWTGVMSVPLGETGSTIEITYNSKLLAIETFQGRECAKIQTRFSGPMEIDLSETGGPGVEGTAAINMTGDLTWYYDHQKSIYVYGEGSVNMDMTMASPNMPDGATSKMIMDVKMTLS